MEKNIKKIATPIKYGVFIIILALSIIAYGQKTSYSMWDKLDYMAAATAAKNSELSAIEQETYYFINLVRMNAPLFAKTYLKDYYDRNKLLEKDVKNYNTVLKELNSEKKMPVIMPLMCRQKNKTISISLKKSSPKELVAQLLTLQTKDAKQIRKLLFNNNTHFAKIQIAESKHDMFLFVTTCPENDLKKTTHNHNDPDKFFIIAGSFSNIETAQDKVTELQEKGYRNSKILRDKDFFQVSVDASPTLLEAQAKAYRLPFNVWIKYPKPKSYEN